MSALLNLARRAVCPVLAKFEPPLLKSKCYGTEHPEKTFLVIRRNEPKVGIGSFVLSTLGWIRFAQNTGMLPIVDMQTLRTMYLSRNERGRLNAWEFFFKQPIGYALPDISRAAHVVIATGIMPFRGFMPTFSTELTEWHDIAQKYLHPSKQSSSAPFNVTKDLIGVLARGTDYVTLHPKDHPVQPSAEQLIKRVRETNPNPTVYLVTEDAAILQSFRTEFGERLIAANQSCVSYKGGYIADRCNGKEARARGIAYLEALSNLAKCPTIVAGKTSGSLLAAILAPPTQESFYFNLGTY